MIDLADYYSGGYFLIRANKYQLEKPGWFQINIQLLPEKVLSLSQCICPSLEVYWSWHPSDREAALKFGVPEEKLDEFVEWCSTYPQPEISPTSMFYSVDAAQRFIDRFLPNTDGLYLIGAGMYQPLEAAGWNRLPSSALKFDIHVDLRLQQAESHIENVEDQITQHAQLAAGGIPLGFEVVSYADSNFSHSWLCSGLHKDMKDLFDIQTGQYGLIKTREDAEKVYEWIAEDDQKGHRAEPEPYAYWLLVSYPLSAEG
jgi:hypothetical protein